MFRSIIWVLVACAALAGLGRTDETKPPAAPPFPAAGSGEILPAGGYGLRPPGAYTGPCPPGTPGYPLDSYAPGTLPGTTPPGTDPNAPNPLSNLQNPFAQAGEGGGEGARTFNPNFFGDLAGVFAAVRVVNRPSTQSGGAGIGGFGGG